MKWKFMNERTVVITEKDGKYQIQNNGIPEFALIGILECIVFDMKNAGRRSEPVPEQAETVRLPEAAAAAVQETKKEIVQDASPNDLRTRISNAVKAIRSLGGEIEDSDRSNATDEELQTELKDLTEQYKRLKNSKAKK
jgi:hypothetical protein